MRIKRGVSAHKRHKKILRATKGYRGLASRTFKMARQAWFKAGEHSLMDRRKRRRDFRTLWIQRINAACRMHDMSYSQFMSKLRVKNIDLNRKMLSEIAFHSPEAFTSLIKSL